MKKSFYSKYIKRLLDITISLSALILLSPVLLVVYILVRTKLGTPVLFKQERPGKNEKVFTMMKFRSMTDQRDDNGDLLPDSIRLTTFGKILRSTSMDELPSLINILKGDMSIVGPRPLLVSYLDLYNDHQKRRHEVRPGLTGLAQVNGRNNLAWEDRFDLDIDYVDSINFLSDLKIILLTARRVFERDGITSETSSTMEPFEGGKLNE